MELGRITTFKEKHKGHKLLANDVPFTDRIVTVTCVDCRDAIQFVRHEMCISPEKCFGGTCPREFACNH